MQQVMTGFRETGYRLLAMALLATCSGMAIADDANQGRELIRNFVNDVQSMSARFEQQLIDANDEIVDESSGLLEIQRPGRFRWTYQEPYEQLLLADGLNVWSYDIDLEQITVKPQAEVLGSTPALLLGGSGNVLEEFDYVSSFTDRGTVWVVLRPDSDENGFTRIELGFSDGQLSRMIFADNLQQSTLIALFDVVTGVDFEPSRFTLVPPVDVDVIGSPLTADIVETGL